MDPSQSELLLKLPIFIEHDSLRCDTCVLMYSAATLNFVSQKYLNRNGLVGKCIRGQKIVVRKVRGQQVPHCFLLAAISPTMCFLS